jgi:predicted ATPase
MSRPYALLRNLFTNHLQIQESAPLPEVWQKMESGVGDKMRAHFLGQMLGYDFTNSPYLKEVLGDARQVRDRALIYLADFLRAAAQLSPVALFLDDIHWADDSSLDALESLFRALARQPLLIVCLTRPTLTERRPDWGTRESQSQIKLSPLSRDASQRLVAELLQKPAHIPAAMGDLILNNAEGNPYYIEELIRMLIEDGVIVREEECWRVSVDRLQAVSVPPTLTGILQARLDGLPDGERKTLQRSAIIGRTFWDRAVYHLSADDPINLEDTLRGLHARELIFPQPVSAFAETREFIFNHAILHDVTYESVLKRHRRRYHAQIARWLIEQSGERLGEYSGLIADHLEKAGQTEQALTYLRQAGERASQTFANAEAIAYFSRALALVSDQDLPERFALLSERERIYDLLGERSAQEQDLAELEALAQQLSPAQQAQAALRRANFTLVTGDFPASSAAAQRAILLARSSQDAVMQAAALVNLGQAFWRLGNYDEALRHLEQVLPLAQQPGAAQAQADALRMMGNLTYDRGQYQDAEEYFNRSLEICRQIGNRTGQSSVLNSLGILYRAIGEEERGREAYLQALQIAQEIGDRRMESALLLNLGVWHRNRADYEQAIQYYQRALLIHREIEEQLYESATLTNLAVIHSHQGKLSKSLHYYKQALEIKRRIGDQRGESVALTGLGAIILHLGLLEQARQHLEQARQLKQQIGDRRGEATILEDLSEYARKAGDPQQGVEYARQSVELAQQFGARSIEGYGHYEMGLSLAVLGQHEQAVESHRQAIQLWNDLGENSLVVGARAHLAHTLLALGRTSEALEQVDLALQAVEIPSMAGNTHPGLMGTDDPPTALLTCYQVLSATGDPRSLEVLETAYQVLQQHAALIDEPDLRRAYLENIPEHRALVEEHGKLAARGG